MRFNTNGFFALFSGDTRIGYQFVSVWPGNIVIASIKPDSTFSSSCRCQNSDFDQVVHPGVEMGLENPASIIAKFLFLKSAAWREMRSPQTCCAKTIFSP